MASNPFTVQEWKIPIYDGVKHDHGLPFIAFQNAIQLVVVMRFRPRLTFHPVPYASYDVPKSSRPQ
jgi:hypothetical protein